MFKGKNIGTKSVNPIVLFAGLALISWLASNDQFASASRIYIPPEPYTLIAADVLLTHLEDDVTGPRPRDSRRAMERVRYAMSDDYPHIAFRLTGAAYGLSITPPQQITLLVERDPKEIENEMTTLAYRETIRAHGAIIDGTLVADPEKAYDSAVSAYERKRLIAWLAVCVGWISIGIAGVLAWRRLGPILRSL